MTDRHNVQRCRWAEPTLFQKNPLWTAAEDYPWSCGIEGEMKPIPDTARCESCGRWAARPPVPVEKAPPAAERCHCDCDGNCGS